ncbi:MAG: YggS family pyridoxal phosphate-dependent enzyme, partial [bacterium]
VFGENRVQEAVEKIDVLQDLSGLEWHLVGHLQKNKARFCPGRFQWIHSLDSLELAKRLSRTCLEQNTSLNVLIQLNLSGEDSKSGLENWDQLRNLSEELMNLEKLELRGLMTMPAPDQDEIETRRVFARLREMQERLKSELNAPQIDQLSMGMTSDYAWAILEGATMIRVGSAIFGARN